MNILLLYPEYPETFWSFRHALRFIDRKASFPPLGLLTVASMLPEHWEKRLVDLNVAKLVEKDLQWADYAFISAMTIQRSSAEDLVRRCHQAGVKVVAGGPLFTASPEEFGDVDHLVLGEAEITLYPFLRDLEQGTAGRVYAAEGRADLSTTPAPLWRLIDFRHYAAMNIQYGRGCPFDCEFCDITALFGRQPRTKGCAQVISEMESLYVLGWRGAIFFVDDNFIGDRQKLKKEVLPAIIRWMEKREHPFYFYTEASIDLADDPVLTHMMVQAGFREVFIGIETPDEIALTETGKTPNRNRDLLASVRTLQQAGLQVHAGFIVGFDADTTSTFDRQIRFIQESGIVTAMVGVLSAIKGTRLYQRLAREGRLRGHDTGNNITMDLNFIPRMEPKKLLTGYQRILDTIYAPRQYYQRVFKLLGEYRPMPQTRFRLQSGYLGALVKSMLILGILGKERLHFWKLFLWSVLRRPKLLPLAITYAIYGFHFRKITEKCREELSCEG